MTVANTFAPARSALPEIGVPGTHHWGGYIVLDENVPELTSARALDTYDRMRRSDGTIRAMLRALKLPLRSASWEIDAATADNIDLAIAAFVRWNLFKGLSHSFRSHLRQALTHLDFGFAAFELVWGEPRVIEGQTRVPLRKIAPRLQRTIAKWDIARDGGLNGVTQTLYGSGNQVGSVYIPITSLALYVHEQEGANWSGESVLRPAYKHWWMKDNFYRFQAIGAERFSVGIVEVKIGENAEDESAALDRAEKIGENIRAHEKGNVALPHDWGFALRGVDGKPYDLLPPIEHHDLAILRSVHAQFLALGAKPEGSAALSGDHSSFFLMHERAIADDISDVVNRFVIPKLVDANFAGVTDYPQLVVRKIETRSLETYFNALATVTGQRLITPDDPTEAELRSLVGLPPHDKTTARKSPVAAPPQPQPAGQRPGTEPPAPDPEPDPAPAEDEEEE